MAFPSAVISAVLSAALLAAIFASVAEGQNDCVNRLVPCASYLNSTKPSKECCDNIRQVVATQLACLCSLYKNPSIVGNINMTQALELPKHCNVSSDTSACSSPAPSGLPPPASAGGSGNGNGNGGIRISWMGMPALVCVLALTYLY